MSCEGLVGQGTLKLGQPQTLIVRTALEMENADADPFVARVDLGN